MKLRFLKNPYGQQKAREKLAQACQAVIGRLTDALGTAVENKKSCKFF